MRWAFWRKEPPPPPRTVAKHFDPPSRKGDTEGTKRASKAPAVSAPPVQGPPTPVPGPAAAPATDTPPSGMPAFSDTGIIKERLGEMLVRKGFVSQESLEKALEVQRSLRVDTYLGEILVREHVLTEEQLATTISRQYKIPFLRIENYDIKKEILDLVPAADARRLRAVPTDRLGRILSIAMVNPLDESAIQELQQITGLKIKPIICLATDLKKVLDLYYPGKKGSTIVLRRGDTPAPFPSAQVPPPPSARTVPEAGVHPATPVPMTNPVTGRVLSPDQARETAQRSSTSAPGPQTILRAAITPPATPVTPESGTEGPAVVAESISEEAFEGAITTNPEYILRRSPGPGVRRKAIPATLISDNEFILFVGALPKK